MTLPKSSDKSFITMFKNKLKSGFPFPLIGMIILMIGTVIAPFSVIVAMENENSYYSLDLGIKIEDIRYLFSADILDIYGNDAYTILLHVVLIIAAITCAITVFKDLSSKRTANIYYSLGFSRKTLFLPTYLSGAACVTAMVVIPYFLAFIINAFVFGITKELMIALLFSTSAYLNMALVAYTTASIAMIMSGMLVEGSFFAFFLNGITSIITFAVGLFSSALLTGAKITTDGINEVYYYVSPFAESLESIFFGKLNAFNSLAHSYDDLNIIGSCLNSFTPNEHTGAYITLENWKAPNWIPVICWTAVLAGLIYIAMRLFEKKKPEDIGFFASNKTLYRIFFTFSVLGFSSMACVGGKTISKGLTWLYILITLSILLLLTLLFKFILTKVARFKLKEERKYFLAYAGVTILVAALFSTGMFGYVNRMPAVEKVKNVKMTAFTSEYGTFDANYLYAGYDGMGSSAIMMDNFNVYGDKACEFKTAGEISSVQDIHKMLIETENANFSSIFDETKIGAIINIQYNLKNGKTIERCYYYVTPQIIENYAKINSVSESVKDKLINNAFYFLEMQTDYEPYEDKFITVFSRDMLSAQNIELTEAQRIGLVEAYRKDVESMTALEILDSETKTVGTITVRVNDDVYGGEGDYTTVIGDRKGYTFESFDYIYECEGVICIKESMKNTVQWAKDNNVFELMQPDYSMSIGNIEATYNDSSAFKNSLVSTNHLNLIFQARSGRRIQDVDMNYYEHYQTYLSPLTGSHVVTGLTNEEMKIVRENAQSFCITNEKGYFIRLTSPAADENVGEMCAVLFIPESKLTAQMKIKFAAISDKEITTGIDVAVTSRY